MRNQCVKSAVLVVVLFVCAVTTVAAQGVTDPGGTYESSWIVVRLATPLENAHPDGTFVPVTGTASVDALIEQKGIYRIEHALKKTMENPADPESLRRYGLDRTYRFYVPAGTDVPALVEIFAVLPGVEFAEPDYIGGGSAVVPNDSRFSNQWSLDQATDADVDGPESWEVGVGGGQVIAVLDTGADSDHPDYAEKLLPGYDFVNLDDDPEDDHGHGTNVGSIASAVTNNGTGIAGACWNCNVIPLKVLDENNLGAYSWWADAFVWAADHGARVVNISAGGLQPSSILLDGVKYAYDAGVIIVSISGNNDINQSQYPGEYAQTINVGGTDSLDQRATPFCYSPVSGSNYSDTVDVVAPGNLILGAAVGGGYESWCGTSQAAPHVAGLVGVMRTINPSVGREEARHLLQSGAEDQVGRPAEDKPGYDEHHGWGRINMDRSLRSTEASISLKVEGTTVTRPYFDTANALAVTYDFIRGDLAAMTESTSGVDLGAVFCLEGNSTDPDTAGNEDTDVPAPGEAFFYVSRFEAAPGHGLYGGSSMNRDRFASAGDCAICGNNIQETPESCDGPDLGGETCQSQGFDAGDLACSSTCDGFDTSSCWLFECGNDVCEPGAGEDCLSCPSDCNGQQGGTPADRYCCGDGDGDNPVSCDDQRCTAAGNTCVE